MEGDNMKWKEMPQPIKVRLVTSFFNRTISFAIMPFMALLFVQAYNKVFAGIFLIGTVILSFLIGLIGGYLADRFPRKRLLVLSTTATGLMFLVMTISLAIDHMLLFTIAYAIFTVTSNIGRPAMSAIIIDATTPENRRAVYAIDYWLINLSIALGTALGGWLYVSNRLFLFSLLTCTSLLLPVAYHFLLDESKHVWQKQPLRHVFRDLGKSYQIAWRDRPFVKVVFGSMCILAAEFSMGSYVAVRLADEFNTGHDRRSDRQWCPDAQFDQYRKYDSRRLSDVFHPAVFEPFLEQTGACRRPCLVHHRLRHGDECQFPDAALDVHLHRDDRGVALFADTERGTSQHDAGRSTRRLFGLCRHVTRRCRFIVPVDAHPRSGARSVHDECLHRTDRLSRTRSGLPRLVPERKNR